MDTSPLTFAPFSKDRPSTSFRLMRPACGGVTGFLRNAALIESHELPMSAHTAPAVHVALGCAVPAMRHLEWFFDHVRIEQMLFDGAPRPEKGELRPDLSHPGLGLSFKRPDADKFRAGA